ncbi:hypothetical protein EDB81DRAFT_786722 [Dactylonectria macrodidyma]|uniref:Secreted protein n=1 Tax=Dactylonectria macrodidyma TaxID=307937 RepID=A0A9P9F6G8_9HYPO|nr:hypothetical protein EDB81DRAFT_786722 [Dactylonectria macrodidyma]
MVSFFLFCTCFVFSFMFLFLCRPEIRSCRPNQMPSVFVETYLGLNSKLQTLHLDTSQLGVLPGRLNLASVRELDALYSFLVGWQVG